MMANSGFRIAVASVGLLLAPPIAAQGTERVSVASDGVQGSGYSASPSISADGRFVAFGSDSTNLVAADTNGQADIFVRDRQSGTTRRMSLSSSGEQANDFCMSPAISADGRFVAFTSRATNLVPGDVNGKIDVFVRDRLAGTTEIVSVASNEAQASDDSSGLALSADGRFVLIQSSAGDLVLGDTNAAMDLFIRDRQEGTTERVSLSTDGSQADFASFGGSISDDGRYVAFSSNATNLAPGDTNSHSDVFLRDRENGTTERVSLGSNDEQGNFGSSDAWISADGRYVSFTSSASNFVAGDTNSWADVFVRDRVAGTTERANLSTGEGQGDFPSGESSISSDGRFVAFKSGARTLIQGDTNGEEDIFVRDRLLGTMERVSVAFDGAQSTADSSSPSISADGRWVVFGTSAGNLVPGDTAGQWDVFVRDLETTGFTSLCDPGLGGIVVCPCSNPPGGPTRGCDNSSSTGGAALSASGVTHLAADSLVFATSGEKPTALSILLQGNGFVTGGVVYGQGMRCVGGSLRRLYVKSASGGSITVPDFGAGDLSVSAQSAAKGDAIQPGQPRWYIVYYRDPVVLGGCPASSTFNATQTGQVSWTL